MLLATIEFITPAAVDAKGRCVYFEGTAAGMIGAFDFEAVAVVDTAGDFEDHGIVEEVHIPMKPSSDSGKKRYQNIGQNKGSVKSCGQAVLFIIGFLVVIGLLVVGF